MTSEDALNLLEERINDVRVAFDAVRVTQNEDSDVDNETHLDEASIALDNFEMHIAALVP